MGSMQRPCNDLNLSVMRAAYEFNNPTRFVNGWSAENKLTSFLKIDGSEGLLFQNKLMFLLEIDSSNICFLNI